MTAFQDIGIEAVDLQAGHCLGLSLAPRSRRSLPRYVGYDVTGDCRTECRAGPRIQLSDHMLDRTQAFIVAMQQLLNVAKSRDARLLRSPLPGATPGRGKVCLPATHAIAWSDIP